MSAPAALVAALPMYDLPWTAEANDALWRAISRRLRDLGVAAPLALTRGRALREIWGDPALAFGQTCGYPYIMELARDVALIAAPEYAFPGCAGATHRSFLVAAKADARRDLGDFRGARAAVNGFDSNTGMNLFRAALAPLAQGRAFFAEVVVTGAHERSLVAIADGRADLAAVDCVSFALVARGRPDLVARVAVVGETPASPSLPFIASARLPEATRTLAREALFAALADPDLAPALRALGLVGARPVALADYARVAELERAAAAQGYPQLA